MLWGLAALLNAAPLIGPFLSLLFTPFSILYTVAIYRDLRQAAGGAVDLDNAWKWPWGIMAAIGFLLPIAGVAGAFLLPQISTLLQQGKAVLEQPGPSAPPQPAEPLAPPPADPTPQPQRVPEESAEAGQADARADHSEPAASEQGRGSPEPAPTLEQDLVVWSMPTQGMGNPFLALKEVSAFGHNEELLLVVTLTRPLADYFTAPEQSQEVTLLLSVYLDTDMNRETGGGSTAVQDGRTGYDMVMQVVLAADQDRRDGRAVVSMSRLQGYAQTTQGSLDNDLIAIDNSILRIRLPFSRFDPMKETVRICLQGHGLSQLTEDKVLNLLTTE